MELLTVTGGGAVGGAGSRSDPGPGQLLLHQAVKQQLGPLVLQVGVGLTHSSLNVPQYTVEFLFVHSFSCQKTQNACIFLLSGKKVNGQIRTLLYKMQAPVAATPTYLSAGLSKGLKCSSSASLARQRPGLPYKQI